jgi:hypothetical protein
LKDTTGRYCQGEHIMNIRRVALVYDDTVRHDTTGTHCRRALDNLVKVEHFLPRGLPNVPRAGFDLYLNVDDGLRDRFPGDLRPSAFWAIDTHLDFEWYRAKAGDFDLVLAAQRDGARRLQGQGIPSARWLPLACDPDVHRKHDVPKRYDVCFVGNLLPGARTEAVRHLQKHFAGMFVGRCYLDEMAETYSASRIVLNRSVLGDVNMRVFEALACGSLLVTNDLADNGQAELFRAGEHLVTYRDLDDLVEKVAYYLEHEDEGERIAAAGREAVLAAHTYRHRMETILRTVDKAGGFSVAKERPATGLIGPWALQNSTEGKA